MTSTRRVGAEQSASRAAILDAAQAMMVQEGYAACSVRRVAAEAGVKPALLQYYFPTQDELFLAVYRRAAEQALDREAAALASPAPLQTLWTLLTDPARTALAVEFMALANHRKAIRTEIGSYAERGRQRQAEALERLLAGGPLDTASHPAAGLSLILAGVARALIMEETLGVQAGHAEGRRMVETWLKHLDAAQPLTRG